MRVRAGVSALTAIATLSLIAPAAMASGTPASHPSAHGGASASPSNLVTLRLAPRDAAAYRDLVSLSGLPRAARAARLARALPSNAARQLVEATVLSQGLQIVDESNWTITVATGSPTATRRFLAATKAPAISSTAPRADGPLAGLVTHVFDGAAAHMTLKPRFSAQVVDGAGARGLYGAPIGPEGSATPLTIATVQFSGWDSSELTTYAGLLGVPDPRANGQYTAISVQGADPTVIDATQGNIEVALDQESMLATAPHVRQRAYFAANDGNGFLAALEKIAGDAANSPDLGIAALSISWGGCEDTTVEAASYYKIIDAAIQDVTAAGVTVFAASGDSGSADCGAGTANAVDFPASDPNVIGVGGTTADAALMQEQAWNGSGGGQSQLWPRPAYQSSLTLDGANRLVPDIAADGDPESGFSVYSGGSLKIFGGTSLAAPIAASTLTTTLAARGFTSGIGYIHPNLYAAPDASFRDVTVGDNGFPAGAGFDMVSGRGGPLWNKLITALDGSPALTAPVYSRSRTVPLSVTVPQGMVYGSWKTGTAKPACNDTGAAVPVPTSLLAPADGRLTVWVLGLAYNGFCYAASRTVVVDTVRPVATTTASKVGTTVKMTWRLTDAAPSSGTSTYGVTIRRSGTTAPIFSAPQTTATAKTFTGTRGHTYTLYVTAKDKAGNVSVVAKRAILV